MGILSGTHPTSKFIEITKCIFTALSVVLFFLGAVGESWDSSRPSGEGEDGEL